MKKLLGILVLGLLWCNTGFAFNGLKGINEFQLEVIAHEECGITKSKVENEVRYLIANSKIKIINSAPNILEVTVSVLKGVAGCFSVHTVKVINWRIIKNTAKKEVTAPLILWKTERMRKGPADTYSIHALDMVENQIKEFVVAWSKTNK